jgi:heme-degrading monooxygenase HmoA
LTDSPDVNFRISKWERLYDQNANGTLWRQVYRVDAQNLENESCIARLASLISGHNSPRVSPQRDEDGSMMALIETDGGQHTVVVVFTVEPGEQRALVGRLERAARRHSRFDGFVGVSILRSEDGLRVIEYVQWKSKAHLDAMRQTPGEAGHIRDRGFTVDAHSYIVSSITRA